MENEQILEQFEVTGFDNSDAVPSIDTEQILNDMLGN
jgi:hypothetical protein